MIDLLLLLPVIIIAFLSNSILSLCEWVVWTGGGAQSSVAQTLVVSNAQSSPASCRLTCFVSMVKMSFTSDGDQSGLCTAFGTGICSDV